LLALKIIGAIVLVIVLINLIAVGADVRYEDGEVRASAKVCGHLFQIYPKPPGKEKKPKKEKKKHGKKKAEEQKEEQEGEKKKKKEKLSLPKDFSKEEILEIAKVGIHAAGSFRKKLSIDVFKLWFVSSDPDPYKTVMTYNYVNDAVCTLGILADRAFRVKKSDIRTATDFNVGTPFIEARLALSIRIGQIVHIGLAAGISALKIMRRHKKEHKKLPKQQAAA
jgi:hypothetical protein